MRSLDSYIPSERTYAVGVTTMVDVAVGRVVMQAQRLEATVLAATVNELRARARAS